MAGPPPPGGVGKPGGAVLGLLVATTALVLWAVATDKVPLLRGPAPYPPEWQWSYRDSTSHGGLLVPFLAAAGLLAIVTLSDSPWARKKPPRAAVVLLSAATLLAWGFQLALLDLEPAGALPTLLARTISRTHTSYYAVAVSPEARDPVEFLRRHASLLPSFRTGAKHAATHPPGPVLYYRGLLALCERAPGLTRLLLTAAEEDVERGEEGAGRAAALLGALLLGLLGAATAWPVAGLAARVAGDPLAGVRVGVLWGLVPGPALFVPQFDQALALPVALAAVLLAGALGKERLAHGLRPLLLAGLLGAGALFVSYGAAVFLLMGGLAVLALSPPPRARAVGLCLLAALMSLGLIGLTALLGHEPLRAAMTALRIHREVYTQPRSYALWLLFDPLDLALFLGVPVAILYLARLPSALARRTGQAERGASGMVLAVAGGTLLLVLSGVTRGEVGRLWIPLMPFLLVAALAQPASEGGAPGPRIGQALVVGALLALSCLIMRVHWIL